MASAMILPISRSPLAEMVPTWAISSLDVTFLDLALSSSTTASTAWSMPRLRSIGLAPAATDLAPSRTIACGQHGCGRGAVAGDVGGLGGDLAQHLRAHVLELVVELDLLGDGHAVLGDARRTIGFLEHDVAAFGAERHLDGIGEDIGAAQHALAGVLGELDIFGCHRLAPPVVAKGEPSRHF